MKRFIPLLGLALCVVGVGERAVAAEPLQLRILYVGDDGDRAADYQAFLKRHFAKVTVAPRKGFEPSAAREADVVLLDWSQSEGPVDKMSSPFGKLENWSKPTVLLGSAGLLMAGQWQLIGGAG